jgi:hypothetical protein
MSATPLSQHGKNTSPSACECKYLFRIVKKTRKSFAINLKKAAASSLLYFCVRVFICVNHCGRESYWSENTKSFSLLVAWVALYYSHRLFHYLSARECCVRRQCMHLPLSPLAHVDDRGIVFVSYFLLVN